MQTKKIHSKSEDKMAKPRITKESLEPSLFFKETATPSKQSIKNRFFSYKFGLVLHDLILAFLVFGLGGRITNFNFYMEGDVSQVVILFILSLVVISFFPTFNLYNYHLIFLKRKHMASLAKSFGWSLLTLGIITAIFILPQFFLNDYLIAIVFLFAVGMMLLSRFYWHQLLYIIKSIGISFFVVGIIGLMRPDENPIYIINWWLIPIGFLLGGMMLTASRFFVVHVVYNIWMRRNFRRQLAIIGSDEEAKNIINHIVTHNAPYWVAGIVGESAPDISLPKHRLGAINGLPDIVEQNKIEEIIVTHENIDKVTLISLLDYCTNKGITVWFPQKLMPIIGMKLNIDNFCDLQMIRLCSQKNTWLFNKIKHGLDALMALPIFVLISPLFLLISVAIKLTSKGPVFYRAQAVGKNGRIFTMYKFRSMRENNQSDIHKKYVTKLIKGEISTENGKDQPLKITNDPRVTSVGKLLRKLSLDELPQLINVLKGEMSMVGPRPCLPYEYEIYKNWHKKRSSVRPGITGLWQVAGRSAVAFEDMILLDLYYIYNRGFSLDFSILYETIFVVLGKRGAH
jgi:exopolysaccharide biosynthesis polyprenyl glycosylphosphotransferase